MKIFERSESCDCSIIHEDIVAEVRKMIPDEELVCDIAELFKVFGDSTRARIICALRISEMCVCDLSVILSMSQSAVSHQLRILKAARLVKNRRNGKVVYYSLNDEHIKDIFDIAFEHIAED